MRAAFRHDQGVHGPGRIVLELVQESGVVDTKERSSAMSDQRAHEPEDITRLLVERIKAGDAEGVAALYKGFVPKVLRLAPGGGVLLLVVEFTLGVFRTGAWAAFRCSCGGADADGRSAGPAVCLESAGTGRGAGHKLFRVLIPLDLGCGWRRTGVYQCRLCGAVTAVCAVCARCGASCGAALALPGP